MNQIELNKAFAEGKSDAYFDGIPKEIEEMPLEQLLFEIEKEKKRLRMAKAKRINKGKK